MPASTTAERLRAAVSVAQMARMVGLSRAQFHWHVHRGAFLPPVYCVRTRRPLYTRSMQERNLRVREEQVGVNGVYVLFYERRLRPVAAAPARRRDARGGDPAARVVEGLRSLGLADVTAEQVAAATASLFPDGTAGTDEGEVLRRLFRHLRRLGVER